VFFKIYSKVFAEFPASATYAIGKFTGWTLRPSECLPDCVIQAGIHPGRLQRTII